MLSPKDKAIAGNGMDAVHRGDVKRRLLTQEDRQGLITQHLAVSLNMRSALASQ